MKKCNHDLIKQLLLDGNTLDFIMNETNCKKATIYKVAKDNSIKVTPNKYLYIKVTKDIYELPLIVADTSIELAKLDGVSTEVVLSSIFRREKYGIKSQYTRVLVDMIDTEDKYEN